MSFTHLPFLYQTRTILRPRRFPRPAFQRRLHAVPRLQRPSADDDIPFADHGHTGTPRDHEAPTEVVDDVPYEGEQNGPQSVEDEVMPQARGTITDRERVIFDSIFRDIAKRGLNKRSPGASGDGTVQERTQRIMTNIMGDAAKRTGQRPGPGVNNEPGGIITPAAQTMAARDPNKAMLRFPSAMRAAALKARDVLGPAPTTSPGSSLAAASYEADELDEWNNAPDDVKLVAQRYPEQKRIEGLMHAAKSDYELFDIMEKHVFVLPDKLGIRKQDPVEKAESGGSKKAAKEKAESQGSHDAVEEQAPTHGEAEDGVKTAEDAESAVTEARDKPPAAAAQTDQNSKLGLYAFGPMYPTLLLLGIRLLDTAFTAPSPLALSVLPRIKELGLESFVLGVSTPLYNALLEIYYNRYGDLTKMLDLLEEMRHSGLYFNRDTTSILNRTQRETETLASGGRGPFIKLVMTMPEYEATVRSRLSYWHSEIDRSVRSEEQDLDFSTIPGYT